MKTLLTFLTCLMFRAALGQPGSNDPSFNPGDSGFGKGDGFDFLVSSVALQPDGKIVAGGGFTSFNGMPRNGIARLDASGLLDVTFNPGAGFNNYVTSITLQPDGKVLVLGNFTSFNGTTRNWIARLHTDGSLDTSFDPGAGFNGNVYSIAIQPDGKIVAGGYFTAFYGTACNRIVRLNADGSFDATFNPGTGFNNAVNSIVLQPDGKMVVVGGFTSFNGTTRNHTIRLNADGSLDTTFGSGAGLNGYVYSSALQPDGKVVLAGDFTSFDGTTRNGIVRLNSDGSLDAAFNPGTAFDNDVRSIALYPDGKILTVGWFTSFNGMILNRIARLNANGSLDITYLGAELNGYVYSAALQPDGKIIVGGEFIYSNGTAPNRLARLNADGWSDALFNPGTGFDKSVRSTILQPDGKIVVVGEFAFLNGTTRNGIARLNTDGSLDTTFSPGTGFDSYVYSIALQPDGKIIAGGSFTSFNGTICKRIARLNADGSLDNTFNPGTGFDNTVSAIALQSDGKIVVGGWFTTVNGTTRSRLARLNADGSLNSTFHPGTVFNQRVNSIALQPDGKMLVGGWFMPFSGVSRNNIVRLNADGSLDATFNPGTGTNNEIYYLALQSDGKIVAGGAFSSFNGVSRNNIVRLNADGSLDVSFDTGTGVGYFVTSIVLQPNGKILVGGSLNSYSGTARNGIARLNTDGSLDPTFDPGTGFNDVVRSIALQPDGKIVAGGGFTSFNGIGRNRVARLFGGGISSIGDNTFATAVQVYPNPAEDQVLIELGEVYPGVEVAVRNLAGQLLLTRQVGTAHTVELGLGELPGGMYLLDVSTLKGEHSVHKIVKH